MSRRFRSTHPSRYFEREQQPKQLMRWESPTWIERNGEFIAAVIGAAVILFALGSIVWAVIGMAVTR